LWFGNSSGFLNNWIPSLISRLFCFAFILRGGAFMALLQTSNLTPRDLNNLAALKSAGISLVEVRISHVSHAKGQLLGNIELPDNTRLVCVLRNGRPITELDAVFLEEKDAIYLITDDENSVREAFTV
jgi:NhaP-type Na+/H+ and K+/H+ antiporter